MVGLEEKKKYLWTITRALCEERGIRLDFTERKEWAINHRERIILCPIQELVDHGAEYCAGCIAHEVGHDYLSRQFSFKSTCLDDVYRLRLFNALEDPRVEAWMMLKYPGVRRWIGYDDRGLQPTKDWKRLPLFKRFIGCCCTVSRSGDRQLIGNAVVAALEQTWDGRRQYHELLPPLNIYTQPLSPDWKNLFRERVIPRLISPDAESGFEDGEKAAYLYSLKGVEIVETEIAEAAQKLIDLDIELLALGLFRGNLQEIAERLLRTGSQKGVTMLVHDLFELMTEQDLDRQPGLPLKVAEELHQAYFGSFKRKPERALSRQKSGRSNPHSKSYSEYRNKVYPQIHLLERQIQEALRQQQRKSEQQGHPWGIRPDLNKIMAFETDPRNYRKLWQRRRIPEKRDAAILLLVDLSGSMRGEKIVAAEEGTVLLVEALERLNIPLAVYGFQNVIFPIVGFEETLDSQTRERIASMSLEVSNSRPGGNNRYEINDDGPCLLAAAEHLLARPEKDKVLIVISDGAPSGGGAKDSDLTAAVRNVTAKGIYLYGLGLGSGTGHVDRFYPNSVANIPVQKLAGELGLLLQKTMT